MPGGFTNKLLQVYVLPSSGSPSTPVITTQRRIYWPGLHSTATFTVVASGAGTLTYQWRYNGSPISGATGTSYTINDVQAGNGRGLRCVGDERGWRQARWQC
ncbi:MAG: immunoglobulin domain-containing protein [Verrucomicrobiota bacterium]